MIWLCILVLLTVEVINIPNAVLSILFSQRANTGNYHKGLCGINQTDMEPAPRTRRDAIVPSGENDEIFKKFATSSPKKEPPKKVIKEDSDFDSESDEDSFNDALTDLDESTELLNSSDSEMDIDMFTFGMPLSFVPGSLFTGFVYVLGNDKLIISFNKGHIEDWFLMNSENFCTCVDDAIFCDCNHVALNIAFRRAVHRVLVHLMGDVISAKKIKITLKVGKNFRLRFETSNKHKQHDCPCDNLLNFIA